MRKDISEETLCRSVRVPDRVAALFAVSEIPEPRPPLRPPLQLKRNGSGWTLKR
jgi:hypothetical protein